MLLSIIIVSYNTSLLTQRAISAADADAQNSPLLSGNTEFIVIDNNSPDSSSTDIKQLTKQLHHPLQLIENKKNSGFAAANNQGIENAKGDYYLLLNSDTEVQPGSLEKLVKTFQAQPRAASTATLSSYQGKIDNIGIVAALLLNEDGSLQAQGGDSPSLLSLASHLFFWDDLPFVGNLLPSTQHTGKNSRLSLKQKELVSMGWVGGTAMLLSKKLIDSIGNLDENIFMYGEDIEFCLRAKNHLFDIVIQPKAQVMHLGSKSSSATKAIEGEMYGYRYIWAKHFPHWQIPLVEFMLRVACFIRWIIFSTIGRQHQATIYRELLHKL